MKITCWNVHYDVNEKKYRHITESENDILNLLECTNKTYNFLKDSWEYSLWYNDTLYENQSVLGIAVFSNKYKLDFTENFNRYFRYVIPLRVIDDKNTLFYLFAVWTKPLPIKYSLNILKACEFPGYKDYLDDKAIFIGDFNTPTKPGKRTEYDNLLAKNLFDCADSKDILKRTYYQDERWEYFTADYCLATKKMLDSFQIKETIPDLDESIKGKDKYMGLSDHCSIHIEISPLKN